MLLALRLLLLAITVHLSPQNDSGEAGTARLIASGPATRISISVQGEPRGAVQPANIHAGRCDSVERIHYGLTDVRAGASTSIVHASLKTLTSGAYAIVLQDSPASLRAAKEYKYVSCGEIAHPRKKR